MEAAKSWTILYDNPSWVLEAPRKVSVARFRPLPGYDCMISHLYRIGVSDSPDCTLCDSDQLMTPEYLDTLQDALFTCYKQSPDNVHSVAFSQHFSNPRLIEDETFNDSNIINNLIDYEDGQEEPDSLRADKNETQDSYEIEHCANCTKIENNCSTVLLPYSTNRIIANCVHDEFLDQGWQTGGTRVINGIRHNILGTQVIKTAYILLQNNKVHYEVLQANASNQSRGGGEQPCLLVLP
ncbi:uncharacterized protein TNCV_4910891 [Trichonephila clavipes]|nr:uncharacterized protein TNCV_4910891 [Trichonephila clavipes]